MLLAVATNVRLGRWQLTVTNEVTYSAVILITTVKKVLRFCILIRYYHTVISFFLHKTGGLYYKTFYGRNLRIFIISYGVYPWQSFSV